MDVSITVSLYLTSSRVGGGLPKTQGHLADQLEILQIATASFRKLWPEQARSCTCPPVFLQDFSPLHQGYLVGGVDKEADGCLDSITYLVHGHLGVRIVHCLQELAEQPCHF